MQVQACYEVNGSQSCKGKKSLHNVTKHEVVVFWEFFVSL